MTQEIKPERITKPIQLLGAWLAGLLAIDSCFLIAAANAPIGSWESRALTTAAIANVPVFLLAVFLLQTRFRPELQEDAYYSSYINQKTNSTIQIDKTHIALTTLEQKIDRLESANRAKATDANATSSDADLSDYIIGINHHLEDARSIAEAVAKAGAVDIREFGANERPDGRVVGIAAGLTPRERKKILRLAASLGFRRFSIIEPWEDIEEHILFGSYGEARNIILLPEA